VSGLQASVKSVESAAGSLVGAAVGLPICPPHLYLQLVMQPSDWPVDERSGLTMSVHIEKS
jgi:hypothetical protein